MLNVPYVFYYVPETVLKLQAIEGKMESENPELYSQALTTCRRLFENVSVELFNKYYPDFSIS